MLGGKAAGQTRPTALGFMTSASTFGLAIPNIYGMMKSSLLAIWAQNLREGTGSKKFKSKKKGLTNYVENVDFLLGANPIVGILQGWQNTTKLPLNFTSVKGIFPGGEIPASYTITDAHFYSVIAVTWSVSYSATFNDYLAPGPVSVSGTYEVPLWNVEMNGPDPSYANANRLYPYIYQWRVAYGNVVYFPVNGIGDLPSGVTGANIYYAATSAALRYETPAFFLRLTFEPTLADGPEYTGNILGTGTPLSSQQVLMPPFAGAGSPNFDLGAAGAMADDRVEVQGSFGIYPTGDADFSDMIEDIVKSGIAQVSPSDSSATTAVTPIQHGASCYDFPGPVQQNYLTYQEGLGNPSSLLFLKPNTAGNILLCFWSGTQNGAITGVTSTSGETWTTIDSGSDGIYSWILAYTISGGYGFGNHVSPQMGGNYGYNNQFYIAEIPIGTFDTSAAQTFATGRTNALSITTGNAQGLPAYVVGFVADSGALATSGTQFDPRWNPLWNLGNQSVGNPVRYTSGQSRSVWSPTLVNLNNYVGSGNARVILASFIQVGPLTVPQPFGALIDNTSMQLCRTQARAYGLWGSLSMQSQKACREWMKDLYSSMNAAPFYSGNLLKQAPYGEQSIAANGATYISPASAGPLANLSDLNGDFLGSPDDPPVTVERKAQFDAPNILQYQIPNRTSDYNPVVVSQPEPGSVALYGVRKDAPEDHEEIADTSVARILLGIKVREKAYIRNSLKFKLGPKGILYEPIDLVTITETLNAMSNYPARFTSLSIGADWQVDCEADPYVFGVYSPLPVTAADLAPYQPSTQGDPGAVNTPIIFEPVPRLFGQGNQPQLWAVISSPSINYGGCICYVSTDGGNSYLPVNNLASGNSSILGNGITGYSTADWPADTDPDTANNLALDLTESLGTLSSYMTADRDNFTYPCYISGGNASIPYALLSYNSAVLTAANEYTLAATGTSNEIRRCVFGAPITPPGPDVDHPGPGSSPVTLGSRFAFLGNPAQPNPPGLMKLTMDPKWIGVTLYFKFLPFNTFGNTVVSLSSVTAYSFAPTGIPGSLTGPPGYSYTQNPAIALSQPTGTHIAMAQVVVTFGANSVTYNARTLTITNPSVPTTYYVTIADSGQVGDTGSGTNLTPTVSTSNALVGVPGQTFIGFIIAVAGGGAGAIAAPGGWPQPASAIVTS